MQGGGGAGGARKPNTSTVESSSGMLNDIKSEPVWSSYLDPEDGTTVMFFNRVTKVSVSDKPNDYDGHYVIGEQTARQKEDQAAKKIYERTFGDMSKMFCTPLEQAEVPIIIPGGVADSTAVAGTASANPGFQGLGMWEEVLEDD